MTNVTETEKEREILEALLDMYIQYCDYGHGFMSAGESASIVLEKYGYATFDESGAIIKVIRQL